MTRPSDSVWIFVEATLSRTAARRSRMYFSGSLPT